jgi:hypothetical protein
MFRIASIRSIIAPIRNLCSLLQLAGQSVSRTTGFLRATHGNIGRFEGAQRYWLGHADIRSLRAGAASNRLQISPFFGRIAGIRSAFYFTRKRRFLAVGRPRPFRHRATRQCSGLFEPTDVSDSDPNPPIPGCGQCRAGAVNRGRYVPSTLTFIP